MMPRKTSLAAVAALMCLQVFGLTPLTSPAGAATETTLHSFQNNGRDGYNPLTALTPVGNTLYGTTSLGGTGRCINGCGTIFSIDPATGTETVSYSLRGKNVTGSAAGSLLAAGNTLFGTTAFDGHRGGGTLFSFDPNSNAFDTLYSFCNLENCADGANPSPGLLKWRGVLYGTTAAGGGLQDFGVVFAFDTKSRTETPLYSFCVAGSCSNGKEPAGGLIRSKSKLYGTTQYGGKGCPINGSCGTVYAVNLEKDSQSVRYDFCSQQSCTDGAIPEAALIERDGLLYGVTQYGGSTEYSCIANRTLGCGTVFSLNPITGSEIVLHAFADDGVDGIEPTAALIEVNGTFYGTTSSGGSNGYGTVYSVDPSTGAEIVIYSFCSQAECADGAGPAAALVNLNGTLYGTTEFGGTGSCFDGINFGCGTVFAITP